MRPPTYEDLKRIETRECHERFVLFQGKWVRQGCQERLQRCEGIYLSEGYRSYEAQKTQFLEQLKRFKTYEETHKYIAVPEVAGHPTGGAVDVRLVGKDMGGEIKDFSNTKILPTFSPFVTEEQRKNRMHLRKIMMDVGFAPYDGEWWHFSYGDKEWAYYYKKPYAIYYLKSPGG